MFFKNYIPLNSRFLEQYDFQNFSELMCHGVCLKNRQNIINNFFNKYVVLAALRLNHMRP